MVTNGNILIQIYEWEKVHILTFVVKVAHFKTFSQFQASHGV